MNHRVALFTLAMRTAAATMAFSAYAQTCTSHTTRDIVAKLHREIEKALSIPDTQCMLGAEGGVASPSTPEEFQAFIRSEVPKWQKIMKEAGVVVD